MKEVLIDRSLISWDIISRQLDPLAGSATRWHGEHLNQVGVRQGTQYAISLAVVHELGAPRELAL